MSRVLLALRVSDLEGSIAFYQSLFGVEPAKLRPGYANFAIAEPPLKLVLIEGEPDQATVLDHLGVEVATTNEVTAASTRLAGLGLNTLDENDITCCYALQDKVWVHGPGNEPSADIVRRPDAGVARWVAPLNPQSGTDNNGRVDPLHRVTPRDRTISRLTG